MLWPVGFSSPPLLAVVRGISHGAAASAQRPGLALKKW